MARRVSFLVHGQVQGVSFRYFTQKKATSYGLTGWVKNTSNSKVEGEAQGEDADVDNLIKDLNKGPSAAHVTKVDKSDIEIVDGESSFDVRS